jgi:hypothetical protein
MFKDPIPNEYSAFSALPLLMGIGWTYFYIPILTNKQIYNNFNGISKIKKIFTRFGR